ncbi:MAG: penicillin-insensitive murein endopeptidase, partial [Nannocystaceae bacterium]|nr:penicillin-insensitive murein endopeptidase [Nannocystaceae bacterium]
VPPGGEQRADLDEPLEHDAPSPASDAVDEPPDDGIVTRREQGPSRDESATDEPVADEPPVQEPPTEDWAKDLERPGVVTYTVRHGGSIKNVANLFKIFHHEIVALNPSVALDQALSPGTSVVVYRQQPGTVSQSVGIASGGTLEGGVPMLDGPGRVLKMIPWKGWATAETVATLDRVLRRWAADESHDQPVLVGNMSARGGGKLPPHSTHQSGRDVDLGYLQKLPKGEELNWREMTTRNLDARATWQLLKLLRATGKLEVVFIDSKIQKLLYEWARTEGGMSKATLRHWMEYPRTPPVRNAIIQHVAGHVDHLHARFRCQPHEKRCKSRRR